MRVHWSKRALEDLLAIRSYIAENNPRNAERFILDLFDTVDRRLKQFPNSGRAVPELDDTSYREIIHGSYRIVYKVDDSVTIRTVRNSKQRFSPAGIE